MTNHQRSELGRESIIDHHVLCSPLIQDGYHIALTKGGSGSSGHHPYIREITLLADIITGDIITDILDQGIITHSDIAEGSMIDAGMTKETLIYLDILIEYSDIHFTVKGDIAHIRWSEILGHVYR